MAVDALRALAPTRCPSVVAARRAMGGVRHSCVVGTLLVTCHRPPASARRARLRVHAALNPPPPPPAHAPRGPGAAIAHLTFSSAV
jgi:hypothetical protein